MISTKELDTFLEKIKKNKIELFYCSGAEITQNDFWLSNTAARTAEMANSGKFEESFTQLFDVIKNKDQISTEIIAMLHSRLAALNEFYYAGVLNYFCYVYFKKGDYSKVPPLDKPYVTMAKNICINRYESDNQMFKSALDGDYQAIISPLVEGYHCLTKDSALRKTKTNIRQEIEDYFEFINKGVLRHCKEKGSNNTATKNGTKESYIQQGLCQHCGGNFKGLFSKKCSACGKPKDY